MPDGKTRRPRQPSYHPRQIKRKSVENGFVSSKRVEPPACARPSPRLREHPGQPGRPLRLLSKLGVHIYQSCTLRLASPCKTIRLGNTGRRQLSGAPGGSGSCTVLRGVAFRDKRTSALHRVDKHFEEVRNPLTISQLPNRIHPINIPPLHAF